MAMAEFDRLGDGSDWIDRELVEREWTPSRSLKRVFSCTNTFGHARRSTAETWLQAFAVRWNRC
jgi:hypothetical protein